MDKAEKDARAKAKEIQQQRASKKAYDAALVYPTSKDVSAQEVPVASATAVKKYAKGGSIDGCAKRGKTRGKFI